MFASNDLHSEFLNVGHKTIYIYVRYFKGINDLRYGISIGISTCRRTNRVGKRFRGQQFLLLVSEGGRERVGCA